MVVVVWDGKLIAAVRAHPAGRMPSWKDNYQVIVIK